MAFRLLCGLAVGLLTALSLAADVIVLKSGRRIEAWGIEERGDRVFYETPSGRVGLPKRLIERIERSGSAPRKGAQAARGAARLPTPDLPGLSDADVGRVVEGGKVNRSLLATLEREADREGSEQARLRAAAAHLLAARLRADRGETADAVASVRRALVFAPNHPALLLYLAALEMEQQRFAAALDHLQPVLAQEEFAFAAYRLQGWIYYQREEMDRAIAAWKKALARKQDSGLKSLLAQAEREATAAAGYRQQASGRFVLRYAEEEVERPRLAASILRALDAMYDELAGTFNVVLREPIVVLLYPRQTFYDLTGMSPNVHAIYDGKIRVPVRGLSSLDARLEQVLRHELVHAFIFFKCRNRAPHWLHEGLAQWHAGQRPPVSRQFFRALFEARDGSALARIEAGFGGDAGQVSAAYAASWLVVDTLQRRYGRADMGDFLEALARGESQAQALRSAFRLTYEDLDRDVYDALR
ncbi:MAG: peptidase MA family metallohydrolase [Terriglobia bacterium]